MDGEDDNDDELLVDCLVGVTKALNGFLMMAAVMRVNKLTNVGLFRVIM